MGIGAVERVRGHVQPQRLHKLLKALHAQPRLRHLAALELLPQRVVDAVVELPFRLAHLDAEAPAGGAQRDGLGLLKVEQRHVGVDEPDRFLHK